MSDLQCPAILLIARHGEVRSVVKGAPFVEGGELTEKGRGQVHQIVEQVRSRRVAAVYSSRMPRAVESAELAASQLGLRSILVDGLQERLSCDEWDLESGCLGAEDADGVVKRFQEAIGHIADTHRGETVLVFTHSGPMSLAIPRLVVNAGLELSGQSSPPHCVVAEVEVDADGWRFVS